MTGGGRHRGLVANVAIAGGLHKDDITVYKSLGHTAQDLVTADAVLRMARASGQYPELPW